MRRLFTTDDARTRGVTIDALRWGEGRLWRRVERGVYADGPEPITQLDRERARVVASRSAARGNLAGVLHGLDGVSLDGRPTRDRPAGGIVSVAGHACADGLQTMLDLAATLDDDTWEHHKGQPVHDARRESAVVATTGWCGRFTWTEVTRIPKSTARRLGEIARQAERRRFVA